MWVVQVAVGGRVQVSSLCEEDGIEKTGDWQCEEENDISVHGWTPEDREAILHRTHIGKMLPRVPVVVCDGPHN
jgi:hypothetical protein